MKNPRPRQHERRIEIV